MNSYETMQNLVQQKLATVKTVGNLSTFKYSRRVMFDNLWKQHPETLECRGHTYDIRTGEIVQAAPRKSFNYLENGHWRDTTPDQPVIMYKKYNGFMACATMYEGKLLVSTTGTTNSDYAVLAKQQIEADAVAMKFVFEDITCVFEIVHKDDPHIVNEKHGVYLLGWRWKDDGKWVPCEARNGKKYIETTRQRAQEIAAKDKGEGFMMYKLTDDNEFVNSVDVCKLKTPYYVGKKLLMRMSPANTLKFYSGNFDRLPEVWDNVANEIRTTVQQEDWLLMKDQQRRVIIEDLEAEYLEI